MGAFVLFLLFAAVLAVVGFGPADPYLLARRVRRALWLSFLTVIALLDLLVRICRRLQPQRVAAE